MIKQDPDLSLFYKHVKTRCQSSKASHNKQKEKLIKDKVLNLSIFDSEKINSGNFHQQLK